MKKLKLFRNRNFTVIAVMVLIILLVLILSQVVRSVPTNLSGSEQIDLNESTGDETEAAAFVLCTLPSSGQYGLIPLPEEGEISYPISQSFTDGTQAQNILHLTPEGFHMELSTCKNQDCVQQGTVTLENRDERVLQNCVICLPNQVMVELYTAEEIAEMDIGNRQAEGAED